MSDNKLSHDPPKYGIAKEAFGIRELVILLAVAETGSFRKAGERLDVGQSAVSRRIQGFEDWLGVSLFERCPTGSRLTHAGHRFASQAQTILRDLQAAVADAKSAGIGDRGQLRIGIIASLSHGPLRNVFEAFLKAHKDVDVCVAESDRSELLMRLSHRDLDAVFAAGEPEPENGDGLLLAKENIFLAVESGHKLTTYDRVQWENVREETFIVSTWEPGPDIHDYILRRVSDLGRTANVRRYHLGREGIMTLVGLGFGVSLTADHWRGVQYPNVTFVPMGGESEHVPFSIVWRPENDNPALRRFLSLARIEAKKNGALS
ncbi:MAG: LysR family transcriptional regulator [Hyphomonas sp.]|uniref:LysR family transcriptional regulator n=1 Tax=Hyphomonas sp. TaxID=87 RepID=UPI000C49BAF7|nr:LysR family transcriptional regulator [Hyphomonas sp.]MAM07129.1 LysR family transcriptional regulator [Hyphomonas sp.]